MTAPTTEPAAGSTADDAVTTSAGPKRRRRHRWLWIGLLVVVVVVLGAVLVAAIRSVSAANSTPDDPGNRKAEGTQALASVLRQHDHPVRVVRGYDELRGAPRPGSRTTVVITDPFGLDGSAAERIERRVAGAGRVVLLGPTNDLLAALDLPVERPFDVGLAARTPALCDVPGVVAPDDASSVGGTYAPTAATGDVRVGVCFPDTLTGRLGALVVVPATAGRPEYVVVASPIVQNATITLADNAGIAVRALGGTDDVLWYVSTKSDRTVASPTPDVRMYPQAFGPLVLLALVGLLALMVWRGRRFGRLVVEPLPAVVKAIETTQSRGRMYHRARATGRAAAQLRLLTLHRLSRRLGLPFDAGGRRAPTDPTTGLPSAAGASVDAIVAATAQATGRDPTDLAALLAGPLPDDDTALLRFTADLTALEKEVRSRP